jgi:hypothetical protein
MKKIIAGISALIITAFVVVMLTGAQNNPQDTKKASTEMSKTDSKCPAASGCCKMKYGTTAEAKPCDKSKCKEMGSDSTKCTAGKVSQDKCKAGCTMASGEEKKCEMAKHNCGTKN